MKELKSEQHSGKRKKASGSSYSDQLTLRLSIMTSRNKSSGPARLVLAGTARAPGNETAPLDHIRRLGLLPR